MGKKLEESGHKKILEYVVEEKIHPRTGKKTKVRTRLRALRVLASLEGPLSGASVHFGLRIWRRSRWIGFWRLAWRGVISRTAIL
jgi:hypothetical protein